MNSRQGHIQAIGDALPTSTRSITPAKTLIGSPVEPVREIDWWLDPNPERALEKYLQMYRSSAYARNNFKAVERLIPRPNRSASTALDYGCGGGRITVHLAQIGYRVVAIAER